MLRQNFDSSVNMTRFQVLWLLFDAVEPIEDVDVDDVVPNFKPLYGLCAFRENDFKRLWTVHGLTRLRS